MSYRVGVIGAGSMGANHVRAILSMDKENSVVVYDPAPYQFESPRCTLAQGLHDLTSSQIDYAVVATPSGTHFEIANELALVGIPTLIEKPLALSVDEACTLEASFDKTKTFAAVGHLERFSPAFGLLKEKVVDGLIGQVAKIETKRAGPYSNRIQDVGVVFDLASHDVDLVTWIMETEVKDFQAIGKSFLSLGNEDTLLVQGTLWSGQLFSHDVNWLTPRKIREISVIGSSGMLVASSVTQRLTLYANQHRSHDWESFRDLLGDSSGQSVSYDISVREPLVSQHEAMQLELEGVSTQICTISQGVRVVRQLDSYRREVRST